MLPVDAVWERWDLVCADPEGCDTLVRVLRVIAWSYVGIMLLIFFVAIRAWTRNLHPAAGIALAAVGSILIVRIGLSWVTASEGIRSLLVITGLGLLAAWIGRPGFAQRSSPAVDHPDRGVNGESSPTSANH